MWTRKKEETQDPQSQSKNGGGAGDGFDDAAARVTAQPAESKTEPEGEATAAGAEDKLIVELEWATFATQICFWPAKKWIHPAFELQESEAIKVSPKMQKFLQVAADKIAPALLARMVNRYPEFLDLLAALALLYIQKAKYVASVIAEEEARVAAAKRVDGERVDDKPSVPADDVLPTGTPYKVGDKLPDGSRLI